jgi:uncharacterized protein
MKNLKEKGTLAEEEKSLLLRCKEAIRSIEPSADVILYGSRARGDAEADSDYDLLILIDEEATLEKEEDICSTLYPIELETGIVLTAMVYSRKVWNTPLYRSMPYRRNVVKEGILL